jgi:hypothetical protein
MNIETERFLAQVDTSGDCWVWRGKRNRHNYGRFYFDGATQGAHVFAALLKQSRPTPTALVRHHCDNPACVRPSHLEWGSHKDNSRDMWERGRARAKRSSGEGNAGVLLTEKQVREIWHEGCSGNCVDGDIAQRFGVSRATISKILGRKSWTHITNDLPGFPRNRVRNRRKIAAHVAPASAKLTEEQVREAIVCLQDGQSIKTVAQMFGVNRFVMQGVASNRTYRHVPRPSTPSVEARRKMERDKRGHALAETLLENKTPFKIACRQHDLGTYVASRLLKGVLRYNARQGWHRAPEKPLQET